MLISDWSSDVCSSDHDLVRLLARVKALQSFIATEDGANLLAGYKRAANILKKEPFNGSPTISLSYAPENEEAALLAALDAAELRAADAVEREDFEGAMYALASLRALIDRSDEHPSELQSLMRISYAVFSLIIKN